MLRIFINYVAGFDFFAKCPRTNVSALGPDGACEEIGTTFALVVIKISHIVLYCAPLKYYTQ